MGPFVLTFFITLFILVMQFLWKYVDDLVGKGLEWNIIAELLLYASANLVPMALPLSILLSSIMTYGNMGEHFELVAMKSAGISLQRAMLPLFAVVLILSGSAFYFSNNIWPIANLKFASLLHDVTKKKPAIDIKEGIFYQEIDGYVIRAGRKDAVNDLLYDLTIYDHTEKDGNRKVIRAKQGSMKLSIDEANLILHLHDGNSYNEVKGKSNPLNRSSFKEETIFIDVSGFKMNRSDQDLFKNNYKMLNINQLSAYVDTIKLEEIAGTNRLSKKFLDGFYIYRDTVHANFFPDTSAVAINIKNENLKDRISVYHTTVNNVRRSKTYITTLSRFKRSNSKLIDRHKIEWHRKFTLSIACLVLFFIGAPLGAIIRKGGLGMPVIISVVFFLVFHVLSITGEKLVKEGSIEPMYGMWLATAVLIPVGAFLSYKSTTDSVLFDKEWYGKLMSKFKKS